MLILHQTQFSQMNLAKGTTTEPRFRNFLWLDLVD